MDDAEGVKRFSDHIVRKIAGHDGEGREPASGLVVRANSSRAQSRG
jgi:hypothetical protein